MASESGTTRSRSLIRTGSLDSGQQRRSATPYVYSLSITMPDCPGDAFFRGLQEEWSAVSTACGILFNGDRMDRTTSSAATLRWRMTSGGGHARCESFKDGFTFQDLLRQIADRFRVMDLESKTQPLDGKPFPLIYHEKNLILQYCVRFLISFASLRIFNVMFEMLTAVNVIQAMNLEELWNMICIDLARCSVPNSFARESNLWTPSCVTLQSILFSSINKCGCSYKPWTFPERQVFGDGLRSINNPISASLAPAGSIAGGVL